MSYAIFDIETRIDKGLLNESQFRGRGLSDEAAYEDISPPALGRTRKRTSSRSRFTYRSRSPSARSLGTHLLQSVESLARADYGEERLAREFWDRVERFKGCLVSFNGRQFDLPVLELAALRYGCAVPSYFGEDSNYRRSYQLGKHFDLYEFITNFGAYPRARRLRPVAAHDRHAGQRAASTARRSRTSGRPASSRRSTSTAVATSSRPTIYSCGSSSCAAG